MDTSKYTLITDTSFYESPIDFVKMKSAGVRGTIIRAGQNLWVDPSFKTYWEDAKKAGLPRGSYWFYDSRIEPKTQAELWVKTMNGDFGELPMSFDIEETYGGAYKGSSNWIIFLEHLKTLIAGHEISLYTTYYYFKDNCKESDKDYFKQYSLWIASYGSDPLLPPPFPKYEMWQFDDKGSGTLYGTGGGAVDLNWFIGTEEEFIKRYNIPNMTVPPTDNIPKIISERKYFDGADYKKYQVQMPIQGLTTYHVIEFEREKADIFVSPYIFNYIPNMIKKYGMDFGINGDGWVTDKKTGITTLTGYAITNGQPYGVKDKEATVYVTAKGFSLIPDPTAKQAFSFANILVKDGVIPVINKVDDWRARTAMGWLKDQSKFYIVTVDGMDYYSTVGMTFKEVARIFFDLGCDFACMLDGGGSTTLAVMDNGVPTLLNKSSGEEKVAGYPYPMRPVAQLIGVKMKTSPIINPPQNKNVPTKTRFTLNNGSVYHSNTIIKK